MSVDLKYLITAADELRNSWREYQADLDMYDLILNPSKPTRYTDPNPYVVKTREEWASRMNSQMVSVWVKAACQIISNHYDRGTPKVRIATLAGDDQVRAGEAMTQAIYDQYRILDMQARRDGLGTSMFRFANDHVIEMGKAVLMVLVQDIGDGRGKLKVSVVDPYNFYHTFEEEPRIFVRERSIPYLQAEREMEGYGKMSPKTGFAMPAKVAQKYERAKRERVSLCEVWCEDEGKVYRTMLADGGKEYGGLQTVYSATEYEESANYRRAPFVMTVMRPGARDRRLSKDRAMTGPDSVDAGGSPVSRHAAPWYAPGAETLRQFEALHSLAYEASGVSIKPPVKVKQQAGKQTPVDLTAGGRTDVTETNDVEITPIEMGGKPYVAEFSLAALEKELNMLMPKSVLNPEVDPGQSDMAFIDEIHQAKTAMVGITRSIGGMWQDVATEINQQIKEKDLKIESTRMEMASDGRTHMILGEWGKEQMPKQWVVNVDLQPELPENKMRIAQELALWVDNGIVDPITARREIAHVESPLQMQAEVDRWRAHNSPARENTRVIDSMLQEMAGVEEEAYQAQRSGDVATEMAARVRLAELHRILDPIIAGLSNGGSPRQEDAMGIPPGVQPADARGGGNVPRMQGTLPLPESLQRNSIPAESPAQASPLGAA